MNSYYLAYLIHVRRQPAPLDTTAMSQDITFVHEGEFEYEIDGERFTVRAGEALYCPKGAKKIRLKSESVYYTSLNFAVSPETRLPLPYHPAMADGAELRFYLKRLLDAYEAGGELRDEKCSSLLSLIVCQLIEQNPLSVENQYISAVRRMIDSDPSGRHSVASLAADVHLNPSYLSTLFRRVTGTTLGEYSLSRRLEYAARLLEEGDSVMSAAERAGFCDVYYFSRIFTNRMRMTPSEYKRLSADTGRMTEEKIESPEPSKPHKNTKRKKISN